MNKKIVKTRVIVWLRNELRIHDNPLLQLGESCPDLDYKDTEVVPVFCFDPAFYTRTVKEYNIRKAGSIRT
jgi:deoxyribodipyrimidine photolyase